MGKGMGWSKRKWGGKEEGGWGNGMEKGIGVKRGLENGIWEGGKGFGELRGHKKRGWGKETRKGFGFQMEWG